LVEVQLSLWLRPKSVVVHGGTAVLKGSARQLVARWRARRPAQRQTSKGSAMGLSVTGLDVTWTDWIDGADPVFLWGLRYHRRPDATELLGIDLLRVGARGITVDLREPAVELRRQGGDRQLEHFAARGATAKVHLGSTDAAQPMAVVSSPQRFSVTIAPTGTATAARGPALRQSLRRFASFVPRLLTEQGKLELTELAVEVTKGHETLRIGPGRLALVRQGDQIQLSFHPGTSQQRTPLALRLNVPLGDGPVEVSLSGGPISFAALGVTEGNLGLVDVARAKLEAETELRLSPDGQTLTASATGKVSGLSLADRRLAEQPLRGVTFSWQGRGEAALDGSRLLVEEAKLSVGRVQVSAKGKLERGSVGTHLYFEGGIPLAACQDLLDSVPEGLLPLVSGMAATGTLRLELMVELDTHQLGKTNVRWKMQDNCHITVVPNAVSPNRFRRPWERRVRGADGQDMIIQSGPGSPNWVPRTAISDYMETGVLVCEDGAFFRHRGFNSEAIANSLRANIKAKRFVRGASTISMQLAKNLYLSRDKTVSRKLQETILTRLLEQELSKDEMMQLYLNVIEFGPGIYGIGPAAAFYFSTTPSDLSLGQALYLASILPNPRRQHFAAGGAVTPGWSGYLRKLMHIAHQRKRISQQELEQGLTEQVVFGVAAPERRAPFGLPFESPNGFTELPLPPDEDEPR
ncbi:biosynthetic peptidoglycan transglycosylase, partial [Myxococcota bacterium]